MKFQRKNSLLFLIFLFQVVPFLLSAQEMVRIDLGGTWFFRSLGSKEWKEATVPGCVHTDLLANKMIADPFYRDNEKDLQWIGKKGWEYQKVFRVSDSLFKNRHIELVCEGLDTWATVYVNDSLVITADNMFREWYADIRPFLHIGVNNIKIRFAAVEEKNKEEYDSLGIKLPGDEKVVARKAAYHFGWDWGPTFITSGIWKPIYIRGWSFMKLLAVQYYQRSLTDSLAQIRADFAVMSTVADTALIQISSGSVVFAVKYVVVRKGPNIIRIEFDIHNPKLWWCNGMGEPYLYNFTHRLQFAGRTISLGSNKFGLRTIELVQDKDNEGKSFYFKLNGVPVFMKGANYIPQDNFLPRVSDSTYRALIASAKDANMNMLRVWGGGTYEKDIFYDLCDENGILVWQDFMFACAMYPPYKGFYKSVSDEAVQNIMRLRRHPSLALWCGNNEVSEGWFNWGWVKQYGYSKEDSMIVYNGYKILFESILPHNIERFDSGRVYIPTSPRFGWGRANSLKEGDCHYWGVWWGKEPFENYTKKVGRFMTEYGFQGFPDWKTIEKFTLPEDRVAGSPVMKAHQKHPSGYELIDEYMQRDYKKPKDLENYAYVSQLLQAKGITTAIEAHRRAKPYCMGTLYWQLNDCWPVVSWSSRDYYGRKKALQFRVKKAFDTYLVSPAYTDGHLKVQAVSDNIHPVDATLSLRLMDLEGKIIWSRILPVHLKENASVSLFDSVMTLSDPGKTLLSAEITSDGKVIASNVLYFVSPKDLSLEKPSVKLNTAKSEEGYTIEITTDRLAKDLYLSSGVDGEFSDNYFDLLPGEKKIVTFRPKQKGGNFTKTLSYRTLFDTY
jgi:beta-mannosidase